MTSSISTQSEPARYYFGLFPRYQEEYEYLKSMNYDVEVQRPKLKPTDRLNFHINMISRSVDSDSVWRLTTLLHSHQEVSCKRFFQEGQDWIKSILFHEDFPSESLEELAQRLVPEVHELFDFDESLFGSDLANGVGSSDYLRLFTVHLRVVVEM